MSDIFQAAPKDSPVMLAWEAYKQTEDYANTRRWVLHAENAARHVDGSLWAAFLQGFTAAQERIAEYQSFFEPFHKTAWEAHQENTKLKERLAQPTAPGEYDELLKRARMILQPPEEVIEIDEDGAVHAPSIRAELATAIEQLQAQLAHWKHCHGVTADALGQAEARLAECKEDAERLHKALTELVELKDLKDRDGDWKPLPAAAEGKP